MADAEKESKIKVENLPQPEQELTPDEQQQVQGGGFALSGRSQAVQDNTKQADITDGTSNTLMVGE
jgi:Protein of unknown function (DUF1559)